MQKSKKDSVLRNYFLGIEIRKTSATFPRAGGVWGGMRAGISEILAGRAYPFNTKIVLVYSIFPLESIAFISFSNS